MRRLCNYKGFTIYQATKYTENNGYLFALFMPDTSPKFDDPEWQADNTSELIDHINDKIKRAKF